MQTTKLSGILIAAIAGAALSLPSRALAQGATNSEATAIRVARRAQNAAIAAGQFDSVATFWLPDIAIVAGLGVTLQGRDVLRAAFAADSGVIYERSTTTVEVSQKWPIAWEEGTWTGRLNRKPAPPLIAGRYSAQWRKVDGRWLIRAEQFVALTCSAKACQWPLAQMAE
jgi:ketosteroid isomerase-like protein